MKEVEFKGFPKIARLSREVVITEKIDGTNAQIFIDEDLEMHVGSRTRWITPKDDNYGFARWARDNEEDLLKLGQGQHFGEWWGSGIQRGYGLTKGDKRFSLFNTVRWCLHGGEPKLIPSDDPTVKNYQELLPKCVGLVPEMYRGEFDSGAIERQIFRLRVMGSEASPGYLKPEGIVVYHLAGRVGFKKTLDNDEIPKSLY